MKKLENELLKYTYMMPALQIWFNVKRQREELRAWRKKSVTLPLPHILKQDILMGYTRDYNLKIFVETGTYTGEMVEAMEPMFDHIYSIELSEKYARRARTYFRSNKNISIIQGDSGSELGKILALIDSPTLFWLDGHYSADDTAMGDKETPIIEELSCLLNATDLGHVILVDDARIFGKSKSYPTIEELKTFVLSRNRLKRIIVQDDIIRILPR